MRDQYRKYMKKLTTESGQSASMKIHKWEYAVEVSFEGPYVREGDLLTYSMEQGPS